MVEISFCCFQNKSGYAQAALDYIYAIKNNTDIDIKVTLLHSEPEKLSLTSEKYSQFISWMKKIRSEDAIQIFHCIPEMQRKVPFTKKTIGFGTFETFNPPPAWIDILNENNAVICPSRFNEKIFLNAGIKKPIYYIPHCYNDLLYNLETKPIAEKLNDKFTFMFVGTWKKRKGYQQLLDAWMTEFDIHDNVQLIIKTDKYTAANKSINDTRINLGLENKEIAPIILEGRVFNELDLPRFYKMADCIVSPTMGEGFGLCFHPDTEVRIFNSENKKIKDIKVGDYVISQKGEKTKVIATSKRKLRKNEKLIKIKHQIKDIILTEDHELLVFRDGLKFIKSKEITTEDFLYCPKSFVDSQFINKITQYKEGFLIPVLEISNSDYNNEVFDLEIEDDSHAFIADNIIAHNCGLQSMALGIPLIITNFSGVTDYANEKTCTLLDHNGFIMYSDMDTIPQFNGSKWAHVEAKEVAKKMRYVLNNYKECMDKTKNALEYVSSNFTYKIIASKFEDMLKNI